MPQELEVLDTTVHKTYAWINEVAEETGWYDRRKGYLALRAVLHALRDRLTVDEAANFSAQLPMLVRGIYFEGWKPAQVPHRVRSKDEFLAEVANRYPNTGDVLDFDEMTRAVFRTIARNISPGEIKDIAGMLPEGIRDYLAAGRPS